MNDTILGWVGYINDTINDTISIISGISLELSVIPFWDTHRTADRGLLSKVRSTMLIIPLVLLLYMNRHEQTNDCVLELASLHLQVFGQIVGNKVVAESCCERRVA